MSIEERHVRLCNMGNLTDSNAMLISINLTILTSVITFSTGTKRHYVNFLKVRLALWDCLKSLWNWDLDMYFMER